MTRTGFRASRQAAERSGIEATNLEYETRTEGASIMRPRTGLAGGVRAWLKPGSTTTPTSAEDEAGALESGEGRIVTDAVVDELRDRAFSDGP